MTIGEEMWDRERERKEVSKERTREKETER